jgi:hypothetical protein
MMGPAVLFGELGSHARGKTLARVLGATAGPLPSAGVAFGFGRSFQERPDDAARCLAWVERPGRALVLLPPFTKEPCKTPVTWEARRTEPLAGGETAISRALAAERIFELRGNLVPVERTGGQVVTATWRSHPAAGVLVVTVLPLWSLRAIEHRDASRAWLEGIVQLAGVPLPEAAIPLDAALTPTPGEWTLLLHLCGGPYATRVEALEALAQSPTFMLERPLADAAWQRLQEAGLVAEGATTPRGDELLNKSSYAAYARTIRRMRHV